MHFAAQFLLRNDGVDFHLAALADFNCPASSELL